MGGGDSRWRTELLVESLDSLRAFRSSVSRDGTSFFPIPCPVLIILCNSGEAGV